MKNMITEVFCLQISWQLPYHHISQLVQPAWLSAPTAHGQPCLMCWIAYLRYSRSSVSKSMAIFSVNRNAVRFFSANRELQLFPAVCALFPPPHFLSAASSFRKGGCLGNDVTSHTWKLWAPMGPMLIGITVPLWGFVGNGVPFTR